MSSCVSRRLTFACSNSCHRYFHQCWSSCGNSSPKYQKFHGGPLVRIRTLSILRWPRRWLSSTKRVLSHLSKRNPFSQPPRGIEMTPTMPALAWIFSALLLVLALLPLISTFAIPPPSHSSGALIKRMSPPQLESRQSRCSNPRVRKAWDKLSDSEKKSYLDATLCLIQKQKAQTQYANVVSRWDDLVGTHQALADSIHHTGLFLPWHRLFMYVHEQILRKECGYTGTIPYWNEQQDAGKFSSSVVFSATNGFGSATTNETNCVPNGPFASMTCRLGPGDPSLNSDHCLMRNVDDQNSFAVGQSNVDICLGNDDFATMWTCIEDMPHAGGHNAVGGDMSFMTTSPNDPVFYMHHCWVDKLWADWQARDDRRLKAIGGGIDPGGSGRDVTANDTLSTGGLWVPVSVGSVLDTRGQVLCYEYQ